MQNKPFQVRNYPDYLGTSGIPLAMGVNLKTSKQTNKKPTFKTTNKTHSAPCLLSCSNGTQMSLLQGSW